MSTIIHFIRHGLTLGNLSHLIQGRTDYPLAKEGIEDAYKYARMYKESGLKYDRVYSSPLKRAIKTAEIFNEILGYDYSINIDEGFIERDFGKAEKLIITDIVYERIQNNGYDEMETNIEIENRLMDATIKVARLNEGREIAIFSHSHSIKALLCILDNKYRFTMPLRNLSMTSFLYEDGKLCIIGVDELPGE